MEFNEISSPVDIEEIKARLNSVEETNKKADAYDKYTENQGHFQSAAKRSEDLTKKIKALDKAVFDSVATVSILPGVTVDLDTGIMINEIPLCQCSTSERFMFATQLAKKNNPEFKVILVRDSNLLDEANLAIVKSFAEKENYQLWIEQVGSQGDIVMEEGEDVSL